MPGPKVFTVEQANENVLDLQRIFESLDNIRKRTQTTKIRLNAIEMIWGEKLQEEECPDHKEFLHFVSELKSLEEQFNAELAKITALGGTVKSTDPGLVDFYAVRDGYLIFLCWRRGDKKIEHWHELDAGFAGRQKL